MLKLGRLIVQIQKTQNPSRCLATSSSIHDYLDPLQCKKWKVDAIRRALSDGLISEQEPLAIFWNVDQFVNELKEAKDAFPSNFTHTIAAKANPLLRIFHLANEHGAGAEAASLGELTQAVRAGFNPKKIVFDSPTKTLNDLIFALEKNVHINVDNFQELQRIESLIGKEHKKPASPRSIGIRVNTQVGKGSIDTHSTSLAWSKFGIGIDEYRSELLSAYEKKEWLNMIHCHVGSQGCPLPLIAEGIKKTVDFVLEVNKKRPNQIKTIDIGGGLPVNFSDENDTPKFKEWADILKAKVPQLFTGEFQVLTEHGRRYLAKAGFITSRVEYTKMAGGRGIASQHAGVDLCIRTVYHPQSWPLRLTVLSEEGIPRPTEYAKKINPKIELDLLEQDVAGPCCIAGDVIAHMRKLPRIHPGDWLIIHDTGAYYHSSWSYYNSRQAPALFFYSEKDGKVTKVKNSSSVGETLRFFS